MIENLVQELAHYVNEAEQVEHWIEKSKRSLIPESPLELADAIANCVELELMNNGKLEAYKSFVKSLRKRVDEAYENISAEALPI